MSRGTKGAATKIGVSQERYDFMRSLGMRWCSWCTAWRPMHAFTATPSRGVDAVHCYCRLCRVERRAVKGRAA